MIEAIVTLAIPGYKACAHDSCDGEPAHTEVYRLEFDTEADVRHWLEDGELIAAAVEKMVGQRSKV